MVATVICLATPRPANAQDAPTSLSDAEFAKTAEKMRDAALHTLDPQVATPRNVRDLNTKAGVPWKKGIVTTVFWIGNGKKGREAQGASAWDPKWESNYGGFDNPSAAKRKDYIPIGFIPRLNPFYVALPYNDVTKNKTKPEAKVVIPWFQEAFEAEGTSVCRDRWIAIRSAAGKVCYAQWADCGPFHTDHWQYVFGNERPRPNVNGGTGLSVSPAVRDYLQLSSTDITDWVFVAPSSVPQGPWCLYGTNNPFTQPKKAPVTSPAVPETLQKAEPLPAVASPERPH